MKLKKLTIHNIASIQSAEINFTAEPLVSSPVFLISGVTGAGKSTILDAICLALYANTPRLRNLAKNGHSKDDVTVEDNKSIGFTDPRNMVRRDAVEGSVRLEFTGNDNIDYIAEWGACRPRRKFGKPFKAAERSLTFTLPGHAETVLTKSSEITPAILKATGLDFKKFCRTTMLAQGEFTRFLHARNEEKSEILESITGTGIYKRIGIKIRENYRQRKQAVEEAELLLGTMRALPDIERTGLIQSLTELNKSLSELTQRNAATLKQIDRLETEARLRTELLNGEERLRIVKTENEQSDIEGKRHLINLYEQTAEPRRLKAEIDNQQRIIAATHDRLNQLKTEFVTLRNGAAHNTIVIEEIKRKLASLQSEISKSLPHRQLLENAPAVAEKIANLITARAESVLKAQNISDIHKAINGPLAVDLASRTQRYAKATESLKTLSETIRQLEIKLNGLNPRDLQRLKDRLTADATIIELNKAIKADMKRLEQTESEFNKLTKACAEAKATYESERESVDAVLKRLRAGLTPGCTCPLCRQKVEVLPDDALLDSLVAEALQRYQEAEKHLYELTDERNRIKAKIEIASGQLTKLSELREQQSALLDETEISKQLSEVEKNLNIAGQIEMQLTQARNDAEQAGKEVSQTGSDLAEADKQMQIARRELEIKSQQLTDNDSRIKRLSTEIIELTSGYPSRIDPLENPGEYAEALMVAGRQFKRANESAAAFEAELAQRETSNNRDLAMLSGIEQWRETAFGKPAEVANLDNRIVALVAEVRSAGDTITNAQKAIAGAERKLLDFNMPDHILNQAMGISPDEVNRAKADCEAAAQRLIVAETSVVNARKALENHLASSHSDNENTSATELKQQAENESRQISEINRQIGAAREKIDADNIVRAKHAEALADLEAKRAEASRWQGLDSLFGDADGKKFSTIAQTYVLMDLIESANRYMASLTDRYRLCVEPNSFVIFVEDSYDGLRRRATNTISGGESFLVSLALALALSDIADSLNVDTLFIDEGFGSLSGEALRDAISTLQQLHVKTGRHVGIISHIEELREQIPVQIVVDRNQKTSISTVKIVSKLDF